MPSKGKTLFHNKRKTLHENDIFSMAKYVTLLCGHHVAKMKHELFYCTPFDVAIFLF
jgi:hypothetical protein